MTRKELEEIADGFLDSDAKKIAWSVNLKRDAVRKIKHDLEVGVIRTALYRPYCKQCLLFDRNFIERPGHTAKFFPSDDATNAAIGVKQRWTGQGQIALIANGIGDLQTDGGWQYFPLYFYEPAEESGKLDLGTNDGEVVGGYRRRDAITDAILKKFRQAYGQEVSKEDIFYYVYGVLHSPEYRTRFAADLKKMLPRIPLTKEAKDFVAFSEAGRELAKWHLNYETVATWPVEEVHDQLELDPWETYKVAKMTFGRPTVEQKAAGAKWDKSRIIYNSHVTITKIPLEAYEYVVNGKPAIEWVMERYQVTRDKDSGIVNDPNEWCKEHDQPRYIIDLVERVVRVSIETMKIVRGLPGLNERVGGRG
jgi:predicted helicase